MSIDKNIAKKSDNNHPSIKTIANYWRTKQESGDFELSQEVDWDMPDCFACGDTPTSLQRAHIIGKQFGVNNQPSNFLLLCRYCHNTCPDVNNRAMVMAWVNKQPLRIARMLHLCRQAFEESGITEAECANFDYKKFEEDAIALSGLHWGVGLKESTALAATILAIKNQRAQK